MNIEFFNQWIEALRSGEYTQSRDGVFSCKNADGTESFCCLGVANYIYSGDANYLQGTNQIPELNNSTGIDVEDDPGQYRDSIWLHLVCMNDGKGIYSDSPKSFSEIADYLEEKLAPRETTKES